MKFATLALIGATAATRLRSRNYDEPNPTVYEII